jgi:diguanylate cyclase (GGDEF)-like protein
MRLDGFVVFLMLALALFPAGWLTASRRLRHTAPESEDLASASLVSEIERRMLELVARGAALHEVLNTLTEAIERISPQSLCTVMLLDEEHRRRLLIASGPSLPHSYLQAVSGLEIGPEVGACGSAAYRNETVVVQDIATDPRFGTARDFVMSHGLRSCWSQPIRDSKGLVLGTFAIYRRQIWDPRPEELRLARVAGQLAGNAIERIRAEGQLRDALERLSLAERAAHFGIWEADFQKSIVTVSAGLAALLERPASKFQLSRAEFEAMVHPDDRAALWSDSDRRSTPQNEFRLVLPSGKVRWMRSQWAFEHDRQPLTKATGAMIDVTAEKDMIAELSFRAEYDSLTSLLNRASLYERVGRHVRTDSGSMALIYLDLDGFKEINDRLGHATGDSVLKYVAKQLLAGVRRTDTVARIGGDEFVIALFGISGRSEAMRIARSIAEAVAVPVEIDAQGLAISASLGVSLFPADGNDVDALLKCADESMYKVKLAHRSARLAAQGTPDGIDHQQDLCA